MHMQLWGGHEYDIILFSNYDIKYGSSRMSALLHWEEGFSGSYSNELVGMSYFCLPISTDQRSPPLYDFLFCAMMVPIHIRTYLPACLRFLLPVKLIDSVVLWLDRPAVQMGS